MAAVQPATLLTPDLRVVNPATAELQASILAALQALPKSSTKARQVTVDLAPVLADAPVAFGTLAKVHAVTVVDLTGAATPSLKINGTAEAALPLAKGQTRSGLLATTLHLSSPGGGGSLVLELHGE